MRNSPFILTYTIVCLTLRRCKVMKTTVVETFAGTLAETLVKWFVIHEEKVIGPYREDEIKAQLASGSITDTDLIWGRVLSQWKKIAAWQAEVSHVVSTVENLNTQQLWHFAVDGDSK